MSKPTFDCSPELKIQFNRCYDSWRKKHYAGLEELAARCGVSPSYLSHVGRYGRIPGKPILILLALNFELPDPSSLFDAAKLNDRWPYDDGSRIAPKEQEQNGFLSVKLDMGVLTDAIRSIIHTESRPREILDLTQGTPLRMGLNRYQGLIFFDHHSPAKKGFFLEFCEMLAMTLRCKIETVDIPFSEYPDKIRNFEIDLFGPKNVRLGSSPGQTTIPFCRMGLSALIRRRPSPALEGLPPPETQADLLNQSYKIAVLRNSRSHLFANVALRRQDGDLVLCDSIEETVERTMLSGIARPVHLTICNSPSAVQQKELHAADLGLSFSRPENLLELCDDCISVRSDWPELVSLINQSITYLLRTGALQERFEQWLPKNMRGVIQLPEPPA